MFVSKCGLWASDLVSPTRVKAIPDGASMTMRLLSCPYTVNGQVAESQKGEIGREKIQACAILMRENFDIEKTGTRFF